MKAMNLLRRTTLLLIFVCGLTIQNNNATCLKSTESNSSEAKILNNVDNSTCVNIQGRFSDKRPVVTKLQVNKTCVHGPEVKVMAFLSGHEKCSEQTILFVNSERLDCSTEIRCQSEKGIPYSGNGTLCLLKCPKIDVSEESYGLELISGIQEKNLCGLQVYQVNWVRPTGWTGPDPSLYRSFDTPEDLTLMEGTQESSFAALVSGKVNSAVSTDRTRSQWVDLGIHTEACMARPETCGAAGGAISLWVKRQNLGCRGFCGIVSSEDSGGTGSIFFMDWDIFTQHLRFGFIALVQNGSFLIETDLQLSDWTHVTTNYIGPENGQGVGIY